MSYYNTTHENSQMLIDYKEQARNQDEKVLAAFNRLNRPLTPSEIWGYLTGSGELDLNTPLTSIRRSITNLTGENKLVKMDRKGKGRYGRSEFFWMVI